MPKTWRLHPVAPRTTVTTSQRRQPPVRLPSLTGELRMPSLINHVHSPPGHSTGPGTLSQTCQQPHNPHHLFSVCIFNCTLRYIATIILLCNALVYSGTKCIYTFQLRFLFLLFLHLNTFIDPTFHPYYLHHYILCMIPF